VRQRRERAIRHRRRIPVQFGEGADTNCIGFTSNVSATGCYISTTKVLRPGTRLTLSFEVEGRTFVIGGQVRRAYKSSGTFARVKPSGMGVHFDQEAMGLLTMLGL
jgi:hypothetical protein